MTPTGYNPFDKQIKTAMQLMWTSDIKGKDAFEFIDAWNAMQAIAQGEYSIIPTVQLQELLARPVAPPAEPRPPEFGPAMPG